MLEITTYRLKQIDFNGTSEYSPEVNVDVNAPLTFALRAELSKSI